MEYLADTNGRPAPQSDERKTESESRNNYVYDLRGDDGDGKEEGKLTLEEQIAMLHAKLLAKQKRVDALELALDDALELALEDPEDNLGAEAPDVLVPRVTEDMDVSALKAEAWERGWAAPDDVSKEQLLTQLFVGSICISSVKQMAFKELSDLEGSGGSGQKRLAADIFLQHGLEYTGFQEAMDSLSTVSKGTQKHCLRLLQNLCKVRAPALLESIARSPKGCTGNRLTFGRFLRFSSPPPAPGFISGGYWPSLQLSDLSNIDVLIQIVEPSRNIATHAVMPLHYDADSRELFANGRCKHFEFEVPFSPLADDSDDDATEYVSAEWDALDRACKDPGVGLIGRAILRHRESGRMTVALSTTQPEVHGAIDDPIGSYALTFSHYVQSPSLLGEVKFNIRLYSDKVEKDGRLKFRTCPFPHSPDGDASFRDLPSYADMKRPSDDAAVISFNVESIHFSDEIDSDTMSVSDSDDDETALPQTRFRRACTLGHLRTCFIWG